MERYKARKRGKQKRESERECQSEREKIVKIEKPSHFDLNNKKLSILNYIVSIFNNLKRSSYPATHTFCHQKHCGCIFFSSSLFLSFSCLTPSYQCIKCTNQKLHLIVLVFNSLDEEFWSLSNGVHHLPKHTHTHTHTRLYIYLMYYRII